MAWSGTEAFVRAMIFCFGSLFWGMGCSEKRVMPPNPTAPLEFQMHTAMHVDFQADSIPDFTHDYEMKLRLTNESVNRDDSITFRLDFVEFQLQSEEGGRVHPMQGQSLEVRCFPWGELLQVSGWENLREVEDSMWMDFVLGALFPNPPIRESQQWQHRLLRWPYYLSETDHSKQLIDATWQSTEKGTWTYEGTWYGKRGTVQLFDGSVSGSVNANLPNPWVSHHEFRWQRTLPGPIGATQVLEATIDQR